MRVCERCVENALVVHGLPLVGVVKLRRRSFTRITCAGLRPVTRRVCDSVAYFFLAYQVLLQWTLAGWYVALPLTLPLPWYVSIEAHLDAQHEAHLLVYADINSCLTMHFAAALELLDTRRTQPRPSEPGAASGPADAEAAREDLSRRMYSGHDMSSHEVVVRSLLEVLQEFDDASEADRTVRRHQSFSLRSIKLLNRSRCLVYVRCSRMCVGI